MALEDENLESFSLVWLDEKGKDESNIEEQLRQCINHLKIFDDANNCELYIRSVHEGDGIVWVVNNHLGQMMVPCLHQLQQISSIYIFDTNNKIETEWTKKYPKVKGVINELSVLLKLIQMDHTRRGAKKIEEQLVLNVFNTSSSDEQSTTGLNGQFIHSQLLINCLLRMKAASTDKDEMISLSKKQYKDNKNELSIVHEFEENYSADRAIWWYTRESFLYRQLNKALRVQNIDLLFIFRFFIRDIQEQLEKHQCSSSIHVFRGQLMLNEELKLLKDSIGQLISMNSFLSTSTDRQLALSFLYSSTVVDNMQRILFGIDADPRLEGIRPFANITNLSYFP
ncbi:unnamed protein product, partial [Rotaria sordida]